MLEGDPALPLSQLQGGLLIPASQPRPGYPEYCQGLLPSVSSHVTQTQPDTGEAGRSRTEVCLEALVKVAAQTHVNLKLNHHCAQKKLCIFPV